MESRVNSRVMDGIKVNEIDNLLEDIFVSPTHQENLLREIERDGNISLVLEVLFGF